MFSRHFSTRTRKAQIGRAVSEALEQRLALSTTLTLSGTQTLSPAGAFNVSDDTGVDSSTSGFEGEASSAIDQSNPLRVAGFSQHFTTGTNPGNQLNFFFSGDGGDSWDVTLIDGGAAGEDDGLGVIYLRGNPDVTFDANGRIYVSYLGIKVVGSTVTTYVMLGWSDDDGESFSFAELDSGLGLPGAPIALDKPTIACGPVPNSTDQAVYVAYTDDFNTSSKRVVVKGSRNGGQSFQSATVSDTGNGDTLAHVAVSSSGAVIVSWHKHVGGGTTGTGTIYFDRDADGLFGTTSNFGTDVAVQSFSTNQSIRLYRAPGQPERGITTNPVLAIGNPTMANNGRLYISYLDWENISTDDSRVRLAYSDNNGATGSWTSITVDTASSTEFLPSVDIDQATGSVNVFYYTNNGFSADNDDARMRLSTRMDVASGTESWSRTYLTTGFSNEQVDANDGDYADASFQDVHQGTVHGNLLVRHYQHT
ncbi:MAG: hypothetical protein IAG10_10250 [Planctomycetaceae bacterium]|nr:hypothetical protein [Planctomycetaceae bacterium]